MTFVPEEISVFYFEEAKYNPENCEVSLGYSFDKKYFFEEVFQFRDSKAPSNAARKSAFLQAIQYLHIMAGVSYYKAALPPKIELPYKISRETAELFEELYTKGLGEFSYVNKLSLKGRIIFPHSESALEKASAISFSRRSLVPMGGGKDSLVTGEILRQAEEPLSFFVMGSNKTILTVASIPGLPVINVTRKISPLLLELNSQGAYNGHVPISAILSFLLAATAILYDFDSIVMSYEHSASAPTLTLNGEDINHQYSKSLGCEKLIKQFIHEKIASNLNYFSLLRPLSELKITSIFSKLSRYHHDFTSCNSHFKIGKDNAKWCNNCPKCRFVFLALAPFLDKDSLVRIFGSNMLNEDAQLPGFEELCEIRRNKPFECVGEVEESRYAIRLLANNPKWKDDHIVKAIFSKLPEGAASPAFLDEFSNDHLLPEHFLKALDEYLRS